MSGLVMSIAQDVLDIRWRFLYCIHKKEGIINLKVNEVDGVKKTL